MKRTRTAAFVDNSSLDVSERNSMAITLNIHTKSHAVRGRPTLKLYERSIYVRSYTGEPSIENYQAKPAHVNTIVYLDVIEKPVESETSQKRGRKLQEFVYERIRLLIIWCQ